MVSYSFEELITGKCPVGQEAGVSGNQLRIVVPKIQRDYAQGRKGTRSTDVRKLFSGSLLATLRAEDGQEQLLDFIYGYFPDGSFEPLDGQQRLTTLFLLYWLVATPEKRSQLTMADASAVLSYKTRPSAEDFCNFLVNIDYSSLSKSFDDDHARALKNGKELPLLSKHIKNIDDFRHSWLLDPTVDSMLRMLDTLMAQLGTFKEIKALDASRLGNIRFHIRDLRELRQGDVLYVRMNARGLELSDFDNTKSALEADMVEAGVSYRVQNAWRSGIDGPWVDYFWHRAGADIEGMQLGLEEVRRIEEDLKTFILRLAILHWFEKYSGYEAPAPSDEDVESPIDYREEIAAFTEQDAAKRASLNDVLTKYVGLRFDWKHRESSYEDACPSADYAEIVKDMDGLLYRCAESNVWLGADSLAPSVGLVNDDGVRYGFIDSMLNKEFTFTDRLILYGMLTFTRVFPARVIASSGKLQADWAVWLRLVRNLSLPRNSNRPFDNARNVVKAMHGIKEYISKFSSMLEEDPGVPMSEFIIETPISGFDQDIYEEERLKEILRRDREWADKLRKYEDDGYLSDQLRAPLQWAEGDKELFDNYAEILERLMTEEYSGVNLYAAMLLVSDVDADKYPFNERLLSFTFHRDWSFKRYLREKGENGVLAPALKKIADEWISWYDLDRNSRNTTVLEFLAAVISRHIERKDLPLWKRQIAAYPDLISSYSSYGRGHGLIAGVEKGYLIDSVRKDKLRDINLCWLKRTKYSTPDYVLHTTKEEGQEKNSITRHGRIVADGVQGDRDVCSSIGRRRHSPRTYRPVSSQR